jgi:hypothetical protein
MNLLLENDDCQTLIVVNQPGEIRNLGNLPTGLVKTPVRCCCSNRLLRTSGVFFADAPAGVDAVCSRIGKRVPKRSLELPLV